MQEFLQLVLCSTLIESEQISLATTLPLENYSFTLWFYTETLFEFSMLWE